MKLKYKFIHFEERAGKQRDVWLVVNNKSGETLAQIAWHPSWKEYVFSQYRDGIIFSVGCLLDIISFIGHLTQERHP